MIYHSMSETGIGRRMQNENSFSVKGFAPALQGVILGSLSALNANLIVQMGATYYAYG